MISATVILIITILISYLGIKIDLVKYSLFLCSNKFYIWRPFTYSFVHNSYSHLFNNLIMYSIGFFGFFSKFTSTDFLFFYFSSGLISILPFLLINFNKKITLSGNSGITFSIFYAFITSNSKHILFSFFGYNFPVYLIGIFFFILSLYVWKPNGNVSLLTHITGGLFGIFYSIIYL
jgi:membrane associated rhomboid family serine protease